jgi:hypothetical protein
MGTTRGWLSTCLRFLGRQRFGSRVQGQRLDAPDLPGLRLGCEQRLLGARCCAGTGCQRERKPSGRSEAICYWWQRLPGQALGIQR